MVINGKRQEKLIHKEREGEMEGSGSYAIRFPYNGSCWGGVFLGVDISTSSMIVKQLPLFVRYKQIYLRQGEGTSVCKYECIDRGNLSYYGMGARVDMYILIWYGIGFIAY